MPCDTGGSCLAEATTLNWTCPNCRQPLQHRDNSLVCAANHCFDRAKEGYVNLLPANRKRSKDPGDNREMIEARRRVHAAERYRPLALRIATLLGAEVGDAATVLDLGCGEGYYDGVLLEQIKGIGLFGVDVSKPAVRLASRALPAGNFAVASSFDVPLADASVDAAFSVFAPTGDAELGRLLKPGGCFLDVSPGPRHLWELRQMIYEQPRPHAPVERSLVGFDRLEHELLEFTLDLEGQGLQDLIAMTPYAYGGRRESKSQLDTLQGLNLQASFSLALYRRTPG